MNQHTSTDHAETIRRLFDELVELTPGEQAERLTAIGDTAFRQEIAALLDAYDPSDAKIAALNELHALLVHPAADANPHRLIGQRIRQYEIEAHLGSGGMGVVYKARDTKLDRHVALKFLPLHLAASGEARERFIQEAKAASALDHPHICTIHEIGETEEDQLFITMAYYKGQTLKEKISQGPLPIEDALNYAIQIAEGLARAHEAGIVHRDVKPANVMVTKGDTVKLVDFGLAKMSALSLTQVGMILGTMAYMSPEQVSGEAIDYRTDLWSLGIVLYEMLTGEQPFQGANQRVILSAILNKDPEPLSQKISEAPDVLHHLVDRLLAKDRDARYQQATDLLTDLEQLPSDHAVRPGETRWTGPRSGSQITCRLR